MSNKPTTTYADLIINYLQQLDVEYLFGVPGGAIEPLYDALSRHIKLQPCIQPAPQNESIIPLRKRRSSHGIKPIIARHEAGAAFMADGYARETGKLGVCCATTGPGATNLITGVASAYADRVPMLIITPQTALPSFGKKGLQESSSDAVDTVGMFEHCTRYNSLVSHPEQLEGKLYQALINAYRQPKGPVHLSIPMDIMNSPIDASSSGYPVAHLFRQPNIIDEHAYTALVGAVMKSKRTVLFIGGGCKSASDDIIQLAQAINADIVSTPSGKRWVNAYSPHYRGVFGFAGHQSAIDTIMAEDVEIIIAVGTTLGELATSGWDRSLLNRKLVHIAQTSEDFARSPMAGLHVLGNIRCIFQSLANDIHVLNGTHPSISTNPVPEQPVISLLGSQKVNDNYLPDTVKYHNGDSCYSTTMPIKPQWLMRELIQRFPRGTRYIGDAGNTWSWMTHYMMDSETNTLRIGFGFGTMGWAIGAAIGTALGNRNQATVCISGDGSYLMSGQEITVALEHKLPVIYVILNDQALGMVKHGQRLGGAEQIGFELPPVNFAMMARSVGANGHTIKTADDLSKLDLQQILNDNKPTLLDVYIDPEETPPMGARVKTLNMR